MAVARFVRKQAQVVIGPLLVLSLSGYFTYHLVEGDRGLLAWARTSRQLRDVEAQAASVHADRMRAEHQIYLMQSDHLAPDLLDEEARQKLNRVAPGEIVIPNESGLK